MSDDIKGALYKLIGVTIGFFLRPLIFMWLWNLWLVDAFNLPHVGYIVSMVTLAVASMLFQNLEVFPREVKVVDKG